VLPDTNKSEKNTAPDDELNPLSNRLLAANMGRWAEIYFTNRPEHRDQAVADLLRELENEAAKGGDQRVDRAEILSQPLDEGRTPRHSAADRDIVCTACGYTNPAGHTFCGMCGVQLTPPPEDNRTGVESGSPPSGRGIEFFNSDLAEANAPRASYHDIAPEEHALTWTAVSDMDDSDLPHFARQPQPVPYRYRLYVGAILTIVLAGLIYVAKHGNVFSDGQPSPDSKVIPAAQQPVSNAEPEQNTANNVPLPVEKAEKNENQSQTAPAAASQPEAASQNQQTPKRQVSRSAVAPVDTPASLQTRLASEGPSGSEDLAEAERFLNGDRGTAPDLQRAVPLLWLAESKGNGPATLVLADLYLRGEGVPQNCDQARLLLDLAAKKGAKGAGERLSHLQAFGCK
jgi:hypothetical protein